MLVVNNSTHHALASSCLGDGTTTHGKEVTEARSLVMFF